MMMLAAVNIIGHILQYIHTRLFTSDFKENLSLR
jgi:hypothetical protein